MLPKWHALFAVILFYILFPTLSWWALIVAASSVLIDADHYIIFCIKRKSTNLCKAYTDFKELDKKQDNKRFKGKYLFFLCVFHTYEFLFLLFLFSFYNNALLLVLTGFLFHVVTDICYITSTHSKRYLSAYFKAISLVYHLFTRNKKSFGEIYLR